VSAVIVNYNGKDLLGRCLAALRTAAGNLTVETVVVDNGSTDGSLEAVPDDLRPMVLIRTGQNLGFARAANIGMGRARGRFWLLLNTDCFLQPHALQHLVDRLGADPGAAVTGPRLLNPDETLQRSCHDFPRPSVFLLEQSSLWRLLVGRSRVGWPAIATAHQSLRLVDWLTGACWLVRPAAWRALGGFDPGFFFYFEETDLCYRWREQGWRVWFEPAAQAVHLGGGSSHASALLGQYFAGLDRFYREHYTKRARITVRGIVAIMAAIKALRAAAAARRTPDQARQEALVTTARAWRDVLRGRPWTSPAPTRPSADWSVLMPARPAGSALILGGRGRPLPIELRGCRLSRAAPKTDELFDLVAVLHPAQSRFLSARGLEMIARAVRPGGSLYLEVDRRAMRPPATTGRRLAKLGFERSQAYWPRRGFGDPQLWLPLDAPAVHRYYLDNFFHASTPQRRLLRGALRVAIGAGCLERLLPRYAIVATRGRGVHEPGDASAR